MPATTITIAIATQRRATADAKLGPYGPTRPSHQRRRSFRRRARRRRELLECRSDLVCLLVSRLRILQQTSVDNGANSGRHVRGQWARLLTENRGLSSKSVWPTKGRAPAASSYNTPSAHDCASQPQSSQLFRRHVRGCAGVYSRHGQRVCGDRGNIRATRIRLASPKSSTFTLPAAVSMMFDVFRSRCSTPRSCA